MTTLMSPLRGSSASLQQSSGTRRVINRGAQLHYRPQVLTNFRMGGVSTVRFAVSAAAGTTLHFICAIHPWMQGRIKVR